MARGALRYYRGDAPGAKSRVPPERYRANLRRILEPIRSDGALPWLLTPNPMTRAHLYADRGYYRDHRIDALVAHDAHIAREVGAELGVPVVDVHRAFREDPRGESLVPDGVHPYVPGHQLIADLLRRALGAGPGGREPAG